MCVCVCVSVLIASTVFESFRILRSIQWDITINVHGSSCEVPSFLSDFNQILFSRHSFEKVLNIKFHKNPSDGSQVVPRGQTIKLTD